VSSKSEIVTALIKDWRQRGQVQTEFALPRGTKGPEPWVPFRRNRLLEEQINMQPSMIQRDKGRRVFNSAEIVLVIRAINRAIC
jgi:hypothetical protein